MKRLIFYPLSFLAPPFLLAVILTTAESPYTDSNKSLPLSGSATSTLAPLSAPSLTEGKKLRALFVVSNQGTQATELLDAYEVFGASGRFELATVAPEKKPSPTTAALEIMPDYALTEAPPADVLILPSIVDPGNRAIVDWVRDRGRKARLVLVLGGGARLAIASHLLQNRFVTTDPFNAAEIQRLEPRAKWIRGARYVVDENLISSAGVTAAMDASLAAISKLWGDSAATQTRQRLDYLWQKEQDPSFENPESLKKLRPEPKLDWQDFWQLLLRGGYDWDPRRLAVLIFPGVSEMGLAATLDSFPRLPSFKLYSVAKTRTALLTRHGLGILPSWGMPDSTPPVDLLIVPSHSGEVGGNGGTDFLQPEGPLQDPAVRTWITRQNVVVKSFLFDSPGRAYDQNLALISQLESPYASQFIAKVLDYRLSTPPAPVLADWPFVLWIKPLLIGLAGLMMTLGIDFQLHQKQARLSANRSANDKVS